MNILNNYPPGVTGNIEYYTASYHCTNEDCQQYLDGETWEVQCYTELGGSFVVDEADADCPTCGGEGTACD